MDTRFRPVRGSEANILAMPYQEGYLYFATDTGNIFIDSKGKEKFPLGGRGAAVIYGRTNAIQNSGDDYYTIQISGLENPDISVREGDLIINRDGAFYKVIEVLEDEEILTCSRIAVSGSGGGGTGGGDTPTDQIRRGRLTVTNNGESDILNGSTCTFTILATSATDFGGPVDDELQLTITYMLADTNQVINKDVITVAHNVTIPAYDATPFLRDSSSIVIDFQLSGSTTNSFYNDGHLQRRVATHDLNVEWVDSQFSNLKYFTDSIPTSIRFSTGAKRILDVYFDDSLIFTKSYGATAADSTAAPIITKNSAVYELSGEASGDVLGGSYSHGRHTVSAKLSLAKADGSRGSGTDLIKKEVALYLDEGYPLIWFGDMKSTYYEYDNPLVPIRVFDPHAGAQGAEVYLYIDGSDALDGSYYTISNDASNYLYWTLTKLTAGQTTTYQVRVGEDKYETWETVPEFEVLEDPRKMDIARSSLTVDFDSRGRSNSEVAKKRSQLQIGDAYATMTGFNWYNNGWVMDDDNTTCLRISNGASVKLPIGTMSFAGNVPSHTIEMRMKIRNIQNYDKLITNYTRYQVIGDPDKLSSPDIDKSWSDNDVFAEFLAQKATGLASYDAYLTKRLPELREKDKTVPTYEDLEFSYLYRAYDLASAMVKYIGNESSPETEAAICLGPQDGYFSNGTNAVTVDYVEDKIINLTIVYDNGTGTNNLGNNKLMKFYLNGMLTSVARSSAVDTWTIGAPELIISSGGCDIDLYKFRVYNRALGLNEVLKNIAYDNTDVTAWDLAELYVANQSIGEDYQFSFNKMIEYNKNHPDGYIMPYIIFTTDDTDNSTQGKLPWRKDTPVSAGVEFVNTGLDRAYENGELATAAKEANVDVKDYYLHHCPSWISDNSSLSVQGTSSEFYPRRNYKAKTKVNTPKLDENGSTTLDEFGDIVTESTYTMKCHKGPFKEDYDAKKSKAQKFFYYDNDTVGTNKFTLKVDYMESSGTYNMGLANLVNTAYSHHPLLDYNSSGAFVTGTAGKTAQITSYPADKLCWYRNHKGNWKCASTGNTETDKTLITDIYGDVLGDISCANAEDFAKGPWALAKEQGQSKILGGTKSTLPEINDIDKIKENIAATSENGTYDELKSFINTWYSYTPGSLSNITVPKLEDYRTSVQGFPTLAFWQTKTGAKENKEPLFIGRYNMLLDKGSAEAYGFKLGSSYQQAYIDGNPAVADIAECWEFENNSRGYCSFRDPWNRKELSFKAPTGESSEFTANGAPIIADYFEYRYNAHDDYLDMLYSMNSSFENQNTVKKLQKHFGADQISDVESGRKKLLDLYSNWEKAVAWVWSTATDAVIDGKAVPSLGTYKEIELSEYLFTPNKFYIEDSEDNGKYKFATEYAEGISYYLIDSDKNYYGVTVTNVENKVYKANTYYTLKNDSYILAEGAFDASEVYYMLSSVDSIDEFWKLPKPVTYGTTTYQYDTQEYRLAKFKNEVEQHFNLEYLVTYFVITEVLECYDSRGKNAMFASWGPQKQGGDYIWYPIFYDMDTQLGINNTGIPSFDYNIDATEDGTFSTNDSVLWNNLYALFKNLITDKYEQLTGVPSDYFGGKLANPPFVNVDTILSWYRCNPAFTNSYSMKGLRPLIALNLDEQYKYISITNGLVGYPYQNGETTQDTSNTYFYALQGDREMSNKQFLTNRLNYIDSWLAVGNYKRGGANRIRSRISANNAQNTSDKWIEGTSTNGASGLIINTPYYKEDGVTKTHLFDGEYWITMTPVRNMYVTVGTDAANFPSLKYSGTPVRFETSDLEKGVRQSGNYREQLYYIYGLDQMKSLGDLSRLYFQEFELSGKASKMVDLRLGYDGLDEEGNSYKNSGVNDWTIPAAAGTLTGGMPLLREVNLSNITFKNTTPTFDFSSCEKLENFRDVGSNITQVTFADGVALNTLYLSDSTVNLKLVEARLLTDLVLLNPSDALPITRQSDNTLVAKKGLYIAGLSNGKKQTKIISFDIQGGNLGYNSYKLLQMYLEAARTTDANTNRRINLSDVQWSPYVKVTDPDLGFSTTAKYFKDNGHFGLEPYGEDEYNAANWKQYINNGMIYEYTPEAINGITLEGEKVTNIVDASLFTELVNNVHYLSTAEANNEVPNITGYVYINNDTEMDEGEIQEKLASKFPNLTFFFNKVDKGYAARFVIMEDGVETLIGTDKISKAEVTSKFFTNPFDRTESAFSSSRINALRPTKDFLGWSTTNDRNGLVETYDAVAGGLGIDAKHDWAKQKLTADKYDYTFYAVFEDHYWDISFYVVENGGSLTPITKKGYRIVGESKELVDVSVNYKAVHGSTLTDPYIVPTRADEPTIGFEKRYRFLGYTRKIVGNNVYSSANAVSVVNFSKLVATANMSFYAAFVEEGVYDDITDLKYFDISEVTRNDVEGYRVSLKSEYRLGLNGKITLPTTYQDKPVLVIGGFGISEEGMAAPITHVFFKGTPQIKEIAENAFYNCNKLVYFQYPDSLITLGSACFRSCSKLQTFKLNKGLKVIKDWALNGLFDPDSEPYQLYIPGSVTTIETYGITYLQCKCSEIVIGGPDGEKSNLTSIGEMGLALNNGEGQRAPSMTVYGLGNERVRQYLDSHGPSLDSDGFLVPDIKIDYK